MRSFAHGWMLFFVLTLGLSCWTLFAEEKPPATPADGFTAAQKDWDSFEKEIRTIVDQFRSATSQEAREDIRKKYESLVAQADGKLATLRTAATAAYKAAPNQDNAVVETLVRMLADDVRQDKYESALTLGRTMLEQGCENGLMFNFLGISAYSTDDFANADMWLKKAEQAGKLNEDGENCFGDATKAKARFEKELAIRQAEGAKNDLPRVKMETSHGALVIELFENEAPEAVANFVSLVEKGYYDGLTFHRVLPNFMAQGGCPEGTGTGGPGYNIYCECGKPEHRNHFRGTLSMAHAGKDTGGSQFFLTFRPTPFLDGRHTAFGRVVEGLEVLEKIERRDPQAANTPGEKIVKATVVRKREHEYKPRKVE
jgi:cyclophilin family peptidyl-prolyl cis-trans isomerase